jgi:hypothetical protein
MLRGLLDSPDTTVRVEAYRVLSEAGDSIIYSTPINNKFILDIVPSKGPPLNFATRRGASRLAIFGNKPSLDTPSTFATLGNRLTITSQTGDNAVKIFYRDPTVPRPTPVLSKPDIAEIVARLGGVGPAEQQQKFNFSYGEIVSVLQAMNRDSRIVAYNGNQLVPTPVVLQALPRVQSEIDAAPQIQERTRPQGDTTQEPMSDAPPITPADAPGDSRTSRAQTGK